MSDLLTAARQALEALELIDKAMPFPVAKQVMSQLRQAIEQAEQQEPVAWRYNGNLHEFDPSDWATGPVTPLYTTPPQRKPEPLSDEAIRDLWSWAMTAEAESTANTQQHAFARAIEAKHGIGGGE